MQDQKASSSAVHHPHPCQAAGSRRPSRFKPVRFQEYRMQWGGTGVASVAVSVSDVYVLDPDCPALAAIAAATALYDGTEQNRSSSRKACLPSDIELVAAAEAAASGAACGCRRRSRGMRHHQRRLSDNRGEHDGCDEGGGSYGVGEVVWTVQQAGYVHRSRCPRRAAAARAVGVNHCQLHRRLQHLQLHSLVQAKLPPLTQPPRTRPRAFSVSGSVENQQIAKPPPTSPSELPQLPQPVPPQPVLIQPKPSALVKATHVTFKLPPQSPTLTPETTAATTAATSPTLSDDAFSVSVGSAESCAESCVATVAQVLQDALLAAVRAETEPLERQLAEKDAELRRLRQELRDRDARLHRLNRLLTCRRLLQLDGVQKQLRSTDSSGAENGNGAGHGTRGGNGRIGRGYLPSSASSSALSSLL